MVLGYPFGLLKFMDGGLAFGWLWDGFLVECRVGETLQYCNIWFGISISLLSS